MSANHSPAIVLFAHGSSDPAWAVPFEKIRTRVAAQTEQTVALAFLERMSPSLEEAVGRLASEGSTTITLVPLFLAVGGHMRNDLPAMVKDAEQKHRVAISVKPAIGESEKMIDALAEWSIAASVT